MSAPHEDDDGGELERVTVRRECVACGRWFRREVDAVGARFARLCGGCRKRGDEGEVRTHRLTL